MVLQRCQGMTFIGYKVCKANNRCVTVKLLIPNDAKHNIYRKNCAVQETAKHRCDRATVLEIYDADRNTYQQAESCIYGYQSDFMKKAQSFYGMTTKIVPRFVYTVGETVSVPDYDENELEVCTTGIHFYLSTKPLQKYMLGGVLTEGYHDNGRIHFEHSFRKNIFGKNIEHGLFRVWFENGQLFQEYSYEDGKIHGSYRSWNENGKLVEEREYWYGTMKDIKMRNL